LIFDNQEIAKIAGWFRTNVRKDMILEVKIDANVTGGCALIWNNTYYDFSLRYFMRKERAGIVSMLNAYGSPN
jgi:F0F1-type ATP synthase delta subunit